jgi:hypothetical protein
VSGRRHLAAIGVFLAGLAAAAAGWALDEKEEEEAKERIRYATPAPQMDKLAVLRGEWKSQETWEDPGRWKRPGYEGYPGPGGSRTARVDEGPGGFSLLWTETGRGPMGGYETRRILSWDPAAMVYRLDSVHSLFPGIVRLSGSAEKGAFLFRGEDPTLGDKRSVRIRWKDLSETGWTEVVEASERGGPFKLVVTARFERVGKQSEARAGP